MLWAYSMPRGLGFGNALGVAHRVGVLSFRDQLSSDVVPILRIPDPWMPASSWVTPTPRVKVQGLGFWGYS